MKLLVALSTIDYFLLKTKRADRIRFDLLHSPFVRHIVGMRPTHGLTLTESKAELIRDVSSSLGNGMYFVVGRIVSVVRRGMGASDVFSEKSSYDLVLDAGMMMRTYQPSSSPAPHICTSDLQKGSWIAGIGVLYLTLRDDERNCANAGKLLNVFHTDLNTSSPHFGELIPIDYVNENLPYDPDVFRTPHVFAQIEID